MTIIFKLWEKLNSLLGTHCLQCNKCVKICNYVENAVVNTCLLVHWKLYIQIFVMTS